MPDTSDPRRPSLHKLADEESFQRVASPSNKTPEPKGNEIGVSSEILYPHHPKPVFGSDVPYTVIPSVQSSKTSTESPLPSPAPLSWFDVYSTVFSPVPYPLPPQVKQVVDLIPLSTYIFLTGLMSYLLGYLAWGWFYAFAVCAVVGYYFSVGLEREKNKIKFNNDRESGRKLLEKGDGETVEWMNHLVNQLWVTVDPVLLASICDMIEDTVTSVMPAIVKSCNVRDFELGTMSPRVTKIKIYPQEGLDSDIVYGTVQVAFYPTATPKFPASTRPAGTPTPPHFQLSLLLFSRTVTNIVVPVYIGFESFAGTVRFKLKLGSQPPFVKTLAFAFVGLPKIDVGVKLLDRNLPDIVKLPVFRDVVFKQAIDMVFEAFTEPNVVPMNLEKILLGDQVEHELYARGILRVHISRAIGLRKSDISGENDPFVSLSLYPNRPLAKTRVLMDTANPIWNETHYVIVSRDDPANHACLRALVQDWDRLGPADELGHAAIPIEKFCPAIAGENGVNDNDGEEQDSAKVVLDEEAQLKDPKGRKPSNEVNGRGKLQWKVEWLPKLSFKAEDELIKRGEKYYAGILGITIHQCQDLEISDTNLASRPQMDGINSFVRVYLNDEPVYKTRLKIHNPNPYFNAYTERFVRDWRTARISAVVKDQRHHEFDPVVGVVTVSLSDVFKDTDITKETSRWWPLTDGIGYGKIRMSIVFRPIQLALPETQRGYEVGTLVVDRLECRDIVREGNGISTFLDVDLNFPVPGSHTTPVAKKDSNPSWPDSVFSLPVQRRYQANLIFRLKRRTGLHLRSRTIARAEFPLGQLLDGVPTEMTLALVPRGDTLKNHKGHRRIQSSTSDKSTGDFPAPLAVKMDVEGGGDRSNLDPLVAAISSLEGGVDYDVRAARPEETFLSCEVSPSNNVGETATDALNNAVKAAASSTVSFRVVFLPGLSAAHKSVAEDAEQAMELAAVDASAIADDISENEDEDVDPEGGVDCGETPIRKHKLPPHQKEVIVDPKKGEKEIRRSGYLAAEATKAKRVEANAKEAVGTKSSNIDSKGDQNMNPLSNNVTVPSARAALETDPAGDEHHVDGGKGNGNASSRIRQSSSGSFSAEEKDSIYFAQGTEPFPDIHRNLHRRGIVRTMKWSKDVIKNKLSNVVKGGPKLANAETGTVEQEEV